MNIGRGQLRFDDCEGHWMDAETFDSLFEANKIMIENGNEILEHWDEVLSNGRARS